ncbi:DUF4382 domain-containing protein [Yeosuana marina]|uniref:DUF4382 domain-containing protein n=1 Tax=Yeosuana marina TaxID=1565536 RepID=UPI00141F65A3|nr:DUF4382 domain-containing protein [Yeosuana marina]
MNMLHICRTSVFLSFLTIFLSCSTDSLNSNIQDIQLDKTTVSVDLVGNKANFDAVNIEVLDVQVKVIDDETIPDCWLSLNANSKGVYNLLDLTENSTAQLVSGLKIPAGEIYEIKLVLGSNNTIVINGETLPLVMNSEHAKGLVVRTIKTLEPGMDYSFSLNFDVKQSILETYIDNRVILRPVLNTSIEAKSNNL